MKIRNGWVSNSSSSSFCILGVEKDEIVEGLTEESIILMETYGDKETFLTCEYGIEEGDESVFYGIDLNEIKDEKTLSETKDDIVAEFKRLGVIVNKKDIDFIHDGGYSS